MRKIAGAILIILGLVLSAAMPSRAQHGARWTAWLYSAQTGALRLLDSSGAQRDQHTLPLPADYELYPFEIAISPDGQQAAYVVSDAEFQNKRLMFYDLTLRSTRDTPSLDITTDGMSRAAPDNAAYGITSAGDLMFAFGYSSGRGAAWRIDLFNASTGQLMQSLSPAAAELPAGDNIVPVILANRPPLIEFALARENVLLGAYVWNSAAATITPAAGYRSLDFDVFTPTGEIVSAYHEETLPGTGINALSVHIPAPSTTHPFYTLADRALRSPRFVHNGRAIFVQGIGGDNGWLLIDRSGQVRQTWDAQTGIESLIGTADGLLYTVSAPNTEGQAQTTLWHMTVDGDTLNSAPIWSSGSGESPRLVWLADPALADTGDYAAWGDARALVAAPTATPTLAPTGTADPASQPAWSAWIYDGAGGMLRVRGDGTFMSETRLPLPEGYSRITSKPVVSRNGSLIAYAVGNDAQDYALIVYNVPTDEIIVNAQMAVSFNDSLNAFSSEAIFSADDTELAVGFAYAEGWTVWTFDLITGRLFHQMITPSDIHQSPGRTPIIYRFEDGLIWFGLLPDAISNARPISYIWDTRDNTASSVAATPAYPGVNSDTFLPTGEAVTAYHDPRLPYTFVLGQEPDGTLSPPANALFVYRPGLAFITPFYTQDDVSFDFVRFVENGARIFAGGQRANGQRTWLLLERDGGIAGTFPPDSQPEQIAGMRGLATGFVYAKATAGGVELRYVDTRDGLDQGVLIWQGGGGAQLIWAREDVPVPPVMYRVWRQLVPPLSVDDFDIYQPRYEPQATVDPAAPTPTVFPTPAPLFVTGMQVQVQTLDGEILNLRDQPTVRGVLLARIEGGVLVTLLDGPVEADGFVWWQLRVEGGVDPQTGQSTRGLVGWAVENTGDLQTLIPVQPTRTPTSAP